MEWAVESLARCRRRGGFVKTTPRGWVLREGGTGNWPEMAVGPQGRWRAGPASSKEGSGWGRGRVAAPIREDGGPGHRVAGRCRSIDSCSRCGSSVRSFPVLGANWRSRPLVCSLRPRSQERLGRERECRRRAPPDSGVAGELFPVFAGQGQDHGGDGPLPADAP